MSLQMLRLLNIIKNNTNKSSNQIPLDSPNYDIYLEQEDEGKLLSKVANLFTTVETEDWEK